MFETIVKKQEIRNEKRETRIVNRELLIVNHELKFETPSQRHTELVSVSHKYK